MDTSLKDLTTSLDQLIGQANINNIQVAKFDTYSNVFDFIESYEEATTFLNDGKRIQLLNRVFPPGCHRSWFEMEVLPLIGGPTTWLQVKAKIIDRFAAEDYTDMHFHRLRDLQYEEQGKEGLLGFVERILHHYKKAYSISKTNSHAIRFVKASIPKDIRLILNREVSFRDARDEETLKEAVKRYDGFKQALVAEAQDNISRELKSILRSANRGGGSNTGKSLMD